MPDPRDERKQGDARTESERSHKDRDRVDEESEAQPELPEREHAPTRERGGRYGDGWW
jgi:hypothetical protein